MQRAIGGGTSILIAQKSPAIDSHSANAMKFLFVSAQLAGHLDWGGFLKTAVALQQRGHDVLWASGKEVAPQLAAAGVALHTVAQTGWRWPPPPPLDPTSQPDGKIAETARAERALDQWLDVARVRPAVVELLDLCRDFSPDVIVAENFMSAAGIAAEVMGVPFAIAGWPAFQTSANPKTEVIARLARERLDALQAEFKFSGANWTSTDVPAMLSPWLHLSYWSERWFSGVALLEQTVHVGGTSRVVDSLPDDHPSAKLLNGELLNGIEEDESALDAPWVFITLGTSFAADPNFFVAATRAVEEVDAVPIVALGADPATLPDAVRERLAPSAILLEQIHFDAVLPSVSAAVHHGGAGTTHALVTHAVPQIVVPHAADQLHQAYGIARSEVGVGIRPQNVTISALAQVLDQMLLESSQFQANAQRLQDEFAQLGGVDRAADLLEKQN